MNKVGLLGIILDRLFCIKWRTQFLFDFVRNKGQEFLGLEFWNVCYLYFYYDYLRLIAEIAFDIRILLVLVTLQVR